MGSKKSSKNQLKEIVKNLVKNLESTKKIILLKETEK